MGTSSDVGLGGTVIDGGADVGVRDGVRVIVGVGVRVGVRVIVAGSVAVGTDVLVAEGLRVRVGVGVAFGSVVAVGVGAMRSMSASKIQTRSPKVKVSLP